MSTYSMLGFNPETDPPAGFKWTISPARDFVFVLESDAGLGSWFGTFRKVDGKYICCGSQQYNKFGTDIMAGGNDFDEADLSTDDLFVNGDEIYIFILEDGVVYKGVISNFWTGDPETLTYHGTLAFHNVNVNKGEVVEDFISEETSLINDLRMENIFLWRENRGLRRVIDVLKGMMLAGRSL